MNSLAAICALYFLLTLCAAVILCYSFWRKFDVSAKLFLAAEVCVMVTAAMVFCVNYFPNTNVFTPLFIGNIAALSSEILIYFGLVSLVKIPNKKALFSLLFFVVIFAAIGQVIRADFGPSLAVIFISIPTIIVIFFTLQFCISQKNVGLSNNQFFRWIKWFECGVLAIWIVRFFSGFSSSVIEPRAPTDIAIFIFSAQVVFTVFRYFSYVGLRATLVTDGGPKSNKLNAPLADTFAEKNELLRGLIASNRVIGISALASSLAHQLSQPLTAIAFQAASAQRRVKDDVGQQDLAHSLGEISTESEKLANLVSNLRRLFSQQRHEAHEVNLQSITNQIVEFIEPSLNSKQISLYTRFLASPIVIADEIQIQQVLINLLNNAVDAIESANPVDRAITITISQEASMATLSIEDTGTGIKPALQNQIFELYKTSKKTGLGVGLWLCKTIVELYHGTIAISNNAGSGVTVTVQLPAIALPESKV